MATASEKNMDDDPVIVKFRSQFQSKDPNVLAEIFSSMTDSVYQGKAKESNKMKAAATERWGGIAAKFRSLNLIEFKIAMYRFKSAGLTFEEIRRIFLWLDRSGNGRVEYDEFVAGIRGDLSLIRQRVVVYIFRKLDRNASGFVEESELALHLRRANIPDIVEGLKTPQNKAKEFIQLMGTPANGTVTPEGKISVEQMVDFYLTRSLEIQMTDEDFKGMVLMDWGMDASEGAGMPSAAGVEYSIHNRSPAATTNPASRPVVAPTAPATPAPSNERQSPRKASEQMKATPPPSSSAAATAAADKDQFHESPKAPARDTKVSKTSFNGLSTTAPGAAATATTTSSSEILVSNNLNAMIATLQAKISEQQITIDSQQQIITTQQNMLGQLQTMLQQQQGL